MYTTGVLINIYVYVQLSECILSIYSPCRQSPGAAIKIPSGRQLQESSPFVDSDIHPLTPFPSHSGYLSRRNFRLSDSIMETECADESAANGGPYLCPIQSYHTVHADNYISCAAFKLSAAALTLLMLYNTAPHFEKVPCCCRCRVAELWQQR